MTHHAELSGPQLRRSTGFELTLTKGRSSPAPSLTGVWVLLQGPGQVGQIVQLERPQPGRQPKDWVWVLPFLLTCCRNLGNPPPRHTVPQFLHLQNEKIGLLGSNRPPGRLYKEWCKDRACPRKATAFRSRAHMGGQPVWDSGHR